MISCGSSTLSAGNSTVEWAYLHQTVLVFCFCSVDKHLINTPIARWGYMMMINGEANIVYGKLNDIEG